MVNVCVKVAGSEPSVICTLAPMTVPITVRASRTVTRMNLPVVVTVDSVAWTVQFKSVRPRIACTMECVKGMNVHVLMNMWAPGVSGLGAR